MTGQRPLLVIIDDDAGVLDLVGRFAARAGFDVVPCSGGRAGIERLRTGHADLVMVDRRMPDLGGLKVLRAIRDSNPSCQVVLMTSDARVDRAIEAIQLGAMDYLAKPLDVGRLQQMLTGVRDELERRRSVLLMEGDLALRLQFCGMIGRGALMQDLFARIRRLAPHVRTVLISGESGTGKELAARALHHTGPRHDRRFFTVNCSTVAESLFESAPSGPERAAFTGATGHEPRLFPAVDGGTLFLDEVGELPMPIQARLLGVLELGEVHGVGSFQARHVDVQVVAATNRDLRSEVAAGRFRRDLYDHLSTVELELPPLRERREDIPYLTAAFVRDAAERLNKPLAGMTPGAERILAAAPWEGNVRELRNVIERACLVADGSCLSERELVSAMPAALASDVRPPVPHSAAAAADALAHGGDSLARVERDHIQRALRKAGGNKKVAAQMLGVSRRALYRRLERLDLADSISRRVPDLARTGS
jgi:two-component system, NtrC family, response regulator AtoC